MWMAAEETHRVGQLRTSNREVKQWLIESH
jgi:hypothetical protein